MTDPRERWTIEAERRLPGEDQVIARNHAITAAYAELYLRRRELFKWAGMAAFASFQVGLALEPLGSGLATRELEDDLDLIRQTNNEVYADIAWAHLAYEAGGIDEIRRCLEGRCGYHLLRSGFEQMHRAARNGTLDPVLVWDANVLLLEHEQHQTVQPRFGALDYLFGKALTLATMLDFDGNHRRIDPKTLSAFSIFMLTRSWHILAFTGFLPNVVSFEQRWHWIRFSLLPAWQRVDRAEAAVTRIMERFVSLGARGASSASSVAATLSA